MVNIRYVPTVAGTAACLLCSTAFTPLFDGIWWWFGPVLVASLAAMVTAAAGRALRLPLGVQAFVWLAGLTTTVTAMCARDTAVLGVLPTPTTLHSLGSLLAQGGEDIARLAAPVPERPGLVALIVIGMYGVVVIVDLLVVTVGRPTLAGLPLLGLFAVPAAILRGGVGTIPFLLGAAGFLLLLIVDGHQQAGRWTRPTGGRRPIPNRRPGSLALGGRVAFAALVVAVVIPMTLPSLDGNGVLERGLDSAATDSGPSTASVVQPIVSLEQQLHAKQTVELMTVRTTAPQYLRMTALELFDGHRFTLREMRVTKDSRISLGLPGAPRNVPTAPVQADVEVNDGFQQRLLPVPGTPTRIEGLTGDWRYVGVTGTIFSTKADTSGARYRVDAVVPVPRPEDLRREIASVPENLQVDAALPPTLDPRVGELVDAVTARATTPYDQVVAIQNYLRGDDFAYDINGAPTYQDGALTAFLFATRRGYCEQFASAMTVMVRKLGIPARVAVGFTYGTKQPDGNYLVTNKDAHAWPEVWFPNAGWLRFEPTRRVDAGTSAPSYAVPESLEEQPPGEAEQIGPSPVPEPQPEPSASPAPTDGATPTPSPAQAPPPENSTDVGGGTGWLGWVGVTLGVLALATVLGTPAAARLLIRRRRLHAGRTADPGVRVHAAWAELIDVATDLGVRILPSDSPRTGAARLGAYLDADPAATRGLGPPAARLRRRPPPAARLRHHRAAFGEGHDRAAFGPLATRGLGLPEAREHAPNRSAPMPSLYEWNGTPHRDRPVPPRRAAFGLLAGPAVDRSRLDAGHAALGRLARAEEHARYAPPGSPGPAADGATVLADVATASAILRSVAPWTRRIRVAVVPQSVLSRAGSVALATVNRLPSPSFRGKGTAEDGRNPTDPPPAVRERHLMGSGRS